MYWLSNTEMHSYCWQCTKTDRPQSSTVSDFLSGHEESICLICLSQQNDLIREGLLKGIVILSLSYGVVITWSYLTFVSLLRSTLGMFYLRRENSEATFYCLHVNSLFFKCQTDVFSSLICIVFHFKLIQICAQFQKE